MAVSVFDFSETTPEKLAQVQRDYDAAVDRMDAASDRMVSAWSGNRASIGEKISSVGGWLSSAWNHWLAEKDLDWVKQSGDERKFSMAMDTLSVTPLGSLRAAGTAAKVAKGAKVLPRFGTRAARVLSRWGTPVKAEVGKGLRTVGHQATYVADVLAGNWRRALGVGRVAAKANYAQKQVDRLTGVVNKLKREADSLAGAAVKSVNGKTAAIIRTDLRARAAIKESQAKVYAKQLKAQQANLKDATQRLARLRKQGIISKTEFQAQEQALGLAQEVASKHGVGAALKAVGKRGPLVALEGIALGGVLYAKGKYDESVAKEASKRAAEEAALPENIRAAGFANLKEFANEDNRRAAVSNVAALRQRFGEIRANGQKILDSFSEEERGTDEYIDTVNAVNQKMYDLIEGMKKTDAWEDSVNQTRREQSDREERMPARKIRESRKQYLIDYPTELEEAAGYGGRGNFYFGQEDLTEPAVPDAPAVSAMTYENIGSEDIADIDTRLDMEAASRIAGGPSTSSGTPSGAVGSVEASVPATSEQDSDFAEFSQMMYNFAREELGKTNTLT